jgi:hypothetical protein
VRFDPEQRRLSNRQWTGGAEALNQFSDGFPLLVLTEAAVDGLNARLAAAGHGPVGVERFRPNIVLSGLAAHAEDGLRQLRIEADAQVQLALVKPCPRCPIPNVDPATGTASPEVLQTLGSYRKNPQLNGAPSFGMNAIVLGGLEQIVRVGQAVVVEPRDG